MLFALFCNAKLLNEYKGDTMQIIDKTFSLPYQTLSVLRAFTHNPGESFCFFDIETTGLSPKVSSLYLIGALWYDAKKEKIQTRQWFADDYVSEKDILLSFTDFLSSFPTLVHYNGSGFDLPYIEKKCAEFEIPSPFASVISLDIYREIRKLKTLFDVPNLKLFTIEKLAGFLRKDILSGKDCIQVYSRFMQKKYFRDASLENERQKLLLHNLEDIIGTYYSAQLLAYTLSGTFVSLTESDEFVIASFASDGVFPFPAKSEKSPFLIEYSENKLFLHLPLTRGTMKHFFKNYKDYFFLPAEDTAIHKSVGTYVEKDFREPAKAANCYVKKEGVFFPVPAGLAVDNRTTFQTEYKSKQQYLLWEDNLKQDSSLMEEILCLLL